MSDFKIVVPEFIDDALAHDIAERGARERGKYEHRLFWALVVGMLIGALAVAVADIPVIQLFAAIGVMSVLVGAIKTHFLLQSFRKHHYNHFSRKLSGVLVWNTFWYPFTHLQLMACAKAHLAVLMAEGRHVELEAMTRYSWAFQEQKTIGIAAADKLKSIVNKQQRGSGAPEINAIPKHWVLANNLAVAYLCQYRFSEGAVILKDLVARTKDKSARCFLLNNLALCWIREEKFDEAQKCIEEAMSLHGAKTDTMVGIRLHMVKSLLQLKQKNLEDAEKSVRLAREAAVRTKEPIEVQADCDAILGEILSEQGNHDEAQLHYKNALLIYESAQNPSFLKLMECLNSYSLLLRKMGLDALADETIARARKYEAMYLERELATIDAIRMRLASPKAIIAVSQLTDGVPRKILIPTSASQPQPAASEE
jgi:tetratricopeptide (TPR) repeat protein